MRPDYIEQILQTLSMLKSALDPYTKDLLLRARQGYTQRMLLLYLQHEKQVRISQPTLSRWLSTRQATVDRLPDDAFLDYQEQAKLGLPQRRYRRALSRWRGHIEHLRRQGHSLGEILADLRSRGVSTSIRSIRRELKNGEN